MKHIKYLLFFPIRFVFIFDDHGKLLVNGSRNWDKISLRKLTFNLEIDTEYSISEGVLSKELTKDFFASQKGRTRLKP